MSPPYEKQSLPDLPAMSGTRVVLAHEWGGEVPRRRSRPPARRVSGNIFTIVSFLNSTSQVTLETVGCKRNACAYVVYPGIWTRAARIVSEPFRVKKDLMRFQPALFGAPGRVGGGWLSF